MTSDEQPLLHDPLVGDKAPSKVEERHRLDLESRRHATHHRDEWTNHDLAIVLEEDEPGHWKLSDEEVADRLGRTHGSIRAQRSKARNAK